MIVDVYTKDRAENRLIKSALDVALKYNKFKTRASILDSHLNHIPKSKNIKLDFKKFKNNKIAQSYQSIKNELFIILNQLAPSALTDNKESIALFFDMNKLFEDYISIKIKQKFKENYIIKTQTNSQSLARYQGKKMFDLKPDILLTSRENNQNTIIDVKYKIINENKIEKNFKVSQDDMYQIFAYAQKYQSKYNYLIYPRHQDFQNDIQEVLIDDKSVSFIGYDLVCDCFNINL